MTEMRILTAGDHFLSTEQLSIEGHKQIFELARVLEPVARGEARCSLLDGAILGNLFFEPSTRTRISFGSAFAKLGGRVLETTAQGMTSLAKGESLEDTARVVSGYVDIVALRHPQSGAARRFADAALVPVINCGDGDGEHPTQSLTDLYTMDRELEARHKTIAGAKIAIVGDLKFGRTVHSLVIGLACYPHLSLSLCSPPGLELPDEYRDIAARAGHEVVIASSLDMALEGADVVYMTRYQEERYEAQDVLAPETSRFHLNAAAIAGLDGSAPVIMHPLPRDSRRGELATDLDTSGELAIFRQTDNGVPVRMGLFCALFGLTPETVRKAVKPNAWPLRKKAL